MVGRVQTVNGDVDPSVLGITLTHEHLYMKFTHFYKQPPKQIADKFEKGFSLDTVGYLRQYPYSSQSNLLLNDRDSQEAVLNDVKAFKEFGGGTIVENSTEGLERNIDFLKTVSSKTGVHVVAGTGHYIADLQNDVSIKNTKEDIYNHMLTELTEGCVDYPTVRAGFMGEIASVWPLKDFERKAISAAGEVQAQLGCGVSFHPHRDPQAPFEILRLYAEAGGRVDKAVMSHLDRTLLETEKLLEFAELGSYCQFDLFGTEVSFYQLNETVAMPSDAQRIEKIKALINEGKEDRILMSHDIHTKHRLIDFGGHGYSHIINNVLPRMKNRGISQTTIDKITVGNPANWLTVKF
ncbi:Phosphotriesterase-related protein [Papilio machaon]|uniref:Phosphotriesterase-related protein n=1 Tax=Papilio machaon TaxID=76193 RepID=A0A0N1PFY7_PAPMA|nr:Phosphotriesterase-related protein [Papilio machaon]